MGWVQITPDVTLSNVTLLNNLLLNSYFAWNRRILSFMLGKILARTHYLSFYVMYLTIYMHDSKSIQELLKSRVWVKSFVTQLVDTF